MCQWNLDLIFKAKLKFQSANWKIQHGCQVAILKVTSLKINRLLPIATKGLRSGNHVIYRWTEGQTDREGESSTPPTNFVGRGYKNTINKIFVFQMYLNSKILLTITNSWNSISRVSLSTHHIQYVINCWIGARHLEKSHLIELIGMLITFQNVTCQFNLANEMDRVSSP